MYNKFFKAFISFTALLLTLAVLGSCSQAPAGNNTDTDGASPTDTAKDGADDMDNTEKDTNNGDTDSGDNTVKRPPIAYFSFDALNSNGSFTEELSGAQCNSIGSPTYTKYGRSGGALLLDGNSYLSAKIEHPTGNEEHSITAWVKLNKSKMTATSDHVIAGWGEYSPLLDTRLLIYHNQFCVSSYGVYTAYGLNENLSSNWVHVALTYSDNTYKLYINGTIAGEVKSSNDINMQNTDLFIGGFGSAGLKFVGMIDELCIYDEALTDAEVAENMAGNIDYKEDFESMLKIFEGAGSKFNTGWNSFMYANKNDNVLFDMYIPEGYSPDKKYPIAVFLHGDGHNGNAPHQVVTGGEATFVKRSIIETDEDCIYIVPAAKSRWLTVPNDKNTVYPYLDYSMSDATPSATLNAVRDLLHECIDVMAIDENRVYLIGYSRGTMAGFYWLSEEPELFAGALLCCGASDPASAHKYKDVPIWAFIGDKDPLVSTERFKAVFDAYKAAGGNGKFTFFEGGEHSLKSYMHAEAGVLEWLFSQKKA